MASRSATASVSDVPVGGLPAPCRGRVGHRRSWDDLDFAESASVTTRPSAPRWRRSVQPAVEGGRVRRRGSVRQAATNAPGVASAASASFWTIDHASRKQRSRRLEMRASKAATSPWAARRTSASSVPLSRRCAGAVVSTSSLKSGDRKPERRSLVTSPDAGRHASGWVSGSNATHEPGAAGRNDGSDVAGTSHPAATVVGGKVDDRVPATT